MKTKDKYEDEKRKDVIEKLIFDPTSPISKGSNPVYQATIWQKLCQNLCICSV